MVLTEKQHGLSEVGRENLPGQADFHAPRKIGDSGSDEILKHELRGEERQEHQHCGIDQIAVRKIVGNSRHEAAARKIMGRMWIGDDRGNRHDRTDADHLGKGIADDENEQHRSTPVQLWPQMMPQSGQGRPDQA